MKYRKKPIVIEAEQWFPSAIIRSVAPIGQPFNVKWNTGVYFDPESKTGFSIDTLEGKHEVTPGDWIIIGIKGEKYPCKPDIFEASYEKVDENPIETTNS